MCAADASRPRMNVVGFGILILTGYLTEYPSCFWVKIGTGYPKKLRVRSKMVQTQISVVILMTESGSLVTNPRSFLGQILIRGVLITMFSCSNSLQWFHCIEYLHIKKLHTNVNFIAGILIGLFQVPLKCPFGIRWPWSRVRCGGITRVTSSFPWILVPRPPSVFLLERDWRNSWVNFVMFDDWWDNSAFRKNKHL